MKFTKAKIIVSFVDSLTNEKERILTLCFNIKMVVITHLPIQKKFKITTQ